MHFNDFLAVIFDGNIMMLKTPSKAVLDQASFTAVMDTIRAYRKYQLLLIAR
jgi:hypothetical protein